MKTTKSSSATSTATTTAPTNSSDQSSLFSLIKLAVNCNPLRRKRVSIKSDEKNKGCSNKDVDIKEKKEKHQTDKETAKDFKSRHLFGLNKLIKFIVVPTIISVVAFFYLPWEEWLLTEKQLELLSQYYGVDGDDYMDFLATTDQNINEISFHQVNCSEKGYWREKRLNAAPTRCGTLVTDSLVSAEEAQQLRKLAENLINAYGDVSIYNRESLNLKWINLHNVFRKASKKIFNETQFELVQRASESARYIISATFGIPMDRLFFYNVTQFTRHRPVTTFSEFRHVDKVRSTPLVVTSILWLSTVDYDFVGGRTEFLTGGPEPFSPLVVEPKLGRFAAWTSSYENPHGVHEILAGDRYALIFAFTVNPKLGHRSLSDLRKWSLDPANAPRKSNRLMSGKKGGY